MKFLATAFFAICLTHAPGLLAASTESSNGAAAGEKDMVGWQWANFIVLAGVVAYLVVKYGTPYFAGQTSSIQDALADARQRREEAERRSAEVQRRLANLGAEVTAFRADVLTTREAETSRLKTKTEDEIARIFASARHQIDSFAKTTRLELRRHAADVALQLAEQRLRARMNPAIQHSLNRAFIDDLKA